MTTILHSALIGSDIHEPKGANIAGANRVYVSDGAGSGSWSPVTHSVVSAGMVVGHGYAALTTTPSGITAIIPTDNTVPTNTEGTQILTLSYTPKATSNLLLIEVTMPFGHTDTGDNWYWGVASLLKDSDTSALAAQAVRNPSFVGGGGSILSFKHRMTAGTTSAITFCLRAGTDSAGTLWVNGVDGARILGGAATTSITVTEFKN